MFRKILGNTMLAVGFIIFMIIAGVDDFNMGVARFLTIWISLFGVSVGLMLGSYKLANSEVSRNDK